MGIVATDRWLTAYIKQKKQAESTRDVLKCHQAQISGRLTSYFPATSQASLHTYLCQNGLFTPDKDDERVLQQFIRKKYWGIINREFRTLKRLWRGPDIPIFIFPSETHNRALMKNFNGLSGLSFHDKVLLFVQATNKTIELRKLLMHEYNHVCRLHHDSKKEVDYHLLDTLVMEGLAEMAVEERLGHEQTVVWAKRYSKHTARTNWEKWLCEHQTLSRSHPDHDKWLYGGGKLPKWLGYNAGYHIVQSYMTNRDCSMQATLRKSSETILQGSDFKNTCHDAI